VDGEPVMHIVPGSDALLSLDSPTVGSFIFAEKRDGFIVGARQFHLLTGGLMSMWAAEGWCWRWVAHLGYVLTRDAAASWKGIVDSEETDDDALRGHRSESRALSEDWEAMR
jgi:hypothetical protein